MNIFAFISIFSFLTLLCLPGKLSSCVFCLFSFVVFLFCAFGGNVMSVSSVCVRVFQMKQPLVCASFNTYFECGLVLLTFKEKSAVTLKLDHTQPDQLFYF